MLAVFFVVVCSCLLLLLMMICLFVFDPGKSIRSRIRFSRQREISGEKFPFVDYMFSYSVFIS